MATSTFKAVRKTDRLWSYRTYEIIVPSSARLLTPLDDVLVTFDLVRRISDYVLTLNAAPRVGAE